MRIAICEDVQVQREELVRVVKKWATANAEPLVVREYKNADAFFFGLEAEGLFDILFLDIDMGEGQSGIEVAQRVRKLSDKSVIVFTTAFEEHVFSGYKVQAYDYLLKPIKKEEVFAALDHVRQRRKASREDTIVVSCDREKKRIVVNDIRYVESHRYMLAIHVPEGIVWTRDRISHMAALLPKDIFVFPHRSFIVNLKHVESVGKGTMTMVGGAIIPIARPNQRDIDKRMYAFFG
ncbi:MAG: LytTR family DNA-binding domain-containing protein [Coriobacteriaceae bacterium]|jgi:DNA-binding LytR/AlgR family response regulator|nr:LytTR family DNA-binding domain-containing protein [Coriobacteriaceae bacterium]